MYLLEKKSKTTDSTALESKFSFLETSDGFKRVQFGQYAFACDEQTAFPVIYEKFSSREMCDLNLLSFRPEQLIGFVVRKESPFRSILATK